ncbi:hypothetical protein [Nocardioides sp.]|uniref:hypothetical protein n=1 Tax=Nocardioides sp. TaxID=35761 RepID=UPI00260B6291|nr:hypothetical protein [Nocardioides sp.]
MTPRSRRRPCALSVPVAALVVISSALPAGAAVTMSGSTIYSDGAGDFIRPSCSAGLLVSTGTASTGSACATLTSLFVYADAGADTVDLSTSTAAAFPALKTVQVNLGEDSVADQATGSAFNDAFTGGRDDTASGGSGDDFFDGVGTALGGLGDDVFKEAYDYASGGPGDDRFVQFTATSGTEGGEGFDTWEGDFDQSVVGNLPAGLTFTMGPLAITLRAGHLAVGAHQWHRGRGGRAPAPVRRHLAGQWARGDARHPGLHGQRHDHERRPRRCSVRRSRQRHADRQRRS